MDHGDSMEILTTDLGLNFDHGELDKSMSMEF